ncbi:MAG: chromate resistance protein ChrB domain-containing protein [Gemmatimonadaceae bacterium]
MPEPARHRTGEPDPRPATSWLLLIHQLRTAPAYLRVKVSRRLQRIGAVAIKNSVYVLPHRPDTREDFEWVAREIRESGGEAVIADAALIEGLSDAGVRELFAAARDEEYASILADGRALRRAVAGRKAAGPARRRALERELAQLRHRFDSNAALDFFGAPKREPAASLLNDVARRLTQGRDTAHRNRPRNVGEWRGRTWVTRQHAHVDRIGSAWLIRRFVDPDAQFRFVDPETYTPRKGELRFDMFEAEFTHVGDACTFEVLARRFVPDDDGLRQLGEIVHDVDCKDGKFQRDEASGLGRVIAGIAAAHARDDDRLVRGAALFDDLYAAFAEPREGHE